MKNKKGFTLIELLAVIVILAIIALIAVPIVLNMIENARKSAAKSSGYGYIDAINNNNELASMKNEDMGSIPETINDGTDIDISLINIKIKGKRPTSGTLTITNGRVVSADLCINNYMVNYSNNEATVGEKCGGSTPAVQPVSFEEDDWDVIAANTTSNEYHVGDEKTIQIDVDNDGTNETYHIMIVNNSTPEECSTEGFSQSACGMVLQFKELLKTETNDNKKMNSSSTTVGGWPGSNMYTYLNTTVYGKIPSDLKNVIINTTVISGRESGKSANYKSTDKLYLLSTKEVGINDEYDSLSIETRKLDYYSDNKSREKRYFGSSTRYEWWLRSPGYLNNTNFYYIKSNGYYSNSGASQSYGVAPAFRIGVNS